MANKYTWRKERGQDVYCCTCGKVNAHVFGQNKQWVAQIWADGSNLYSTLRLEQVQTSAVAKRAVEQLFDAVRDNGAQ